VRRKCRRPHAREPGEHFLRAMAVDTNYLVTTLFSGNQHDLGPGTSEPNGEPIYEGPVCTLLHRPCFQPYFKPTIMPAIHLGMPSTCLAVDMQFSHREVREMSTNKIQTAVGF